MLQYILECIAFQLVFLIIYDVFLKRETFFQWNRLYLIGTYIISMVLPWVKIEAMKTTMPESFQAYPEFLWSMNNSAVVTATTQEPTFRFSWEYALLFGGMLLSALFFGYKLYQIYALRQKGEVQYFKDFTRIIIANSSMAFSFFKSIFLGDKVIERDHENILQHELVHIRQRHSYDLIFFEFMRIVGWFNPLVYVYQRRVSELHEFIADAHVAKTHKKEQYQLLLSEVFQTQHISFINQFFKSSLIKKRIVMLSKEKSKKIFQLKYLLLLPLVFGMLFYSSCENKSSNNNELTIEVGSIEELTEEEEKVMFDELVKMTKLESEWALYVRDKNAAMKFVKSIDDSYISGLNGEKIKAKLAIDNSLVTLYPNTGNVDISISELHDSWGERYNLVNTKRNEILEKYSEQSSAAIEINREYKALITELKGDNPEYLEFFWLDQAPIFPECNNELDKAACFEESFLKHIKVNLKYPKASLERKIEGTVNGTLVIENDGTITNGGAEGPTEEMKKEVDRLILSLPKMKPGKFNGNAVATIYSYHIPFKLP